MRILIDGAEQEDREELAEKLSMDLGIIRIENIGHLEVHGYDFYEKLLNGDNYILCGSFIGNRIQDALGNTTSQVGDAEDLRLHRLLESMGVFVVVCCNEFKNDHSVPGKHKILANEQFIRLALNRGYTLYDAEMTSYEMIISAVKAYFNVK